MKNNPSHFKIGHPTSNTGRTHFKKGIIPWNKGKTGLVRGIVGEKNVRWKGDGASYFTKHEWIRNQKGRADHCEVCGSTEKKRYTWANVDHKYRRVLEDYIPMCASCHDKYDQEHNGKVTGRKRLTEKCSTSGCKRMHEARGYCKMHYERLRRSKMVN